MTDNLPAPTDSRTYTGRHRSTEPEYLPGCGCRLWLSNTSGSTDFGAVLNRRHNQTKAGAQ